MEMNQDLLIAIGVIAITLILTLVILTLFLKFLAGKREKLVDKEIAMYNEQLKRKYDALKIKNSKRTKMNKIKENKIRDYQAEIASMKNELVELRATQINANSTVDAAYEHTKIYMKRELTSLSHDIYNDFLLNLNERILEMPCTIIKEIDLLFYNTLVHKCYQFPEIIEITNTIHEKEWAIIKAELQLIESALSSPEVIHRMSYLENSDEYVKFILYILKERNLHRQTIELVLYMCNTYRLAALLNFTRSCIEVIQFLTKKSIIQVQVSNEQLEAEFFKRIKESRYKKYLEFSVSQSEIDYGIAANYQGKIIAVSLFTMLHDYMGSLERIY